MRKDPPQTNYYHRGAPSLSTKKKHPAFSNGRYSSPPTSRQRSLMTAATTSTTRDSSTSHQQVHKSSPTKGTTAPSSTWSSTMDHLPNDPTVSRLSRSATSQQLRQQPSSLVTKGTSNSNKNNAAESSSSYDRTAFYSRHSAAGGRTTPFSTSTSSGSSSVSAADPLYNDYGDDYPALSVVSPSTVSSQYTAYTTEHEGEVEDAVYSVAGSYEPDTEDDDDDIDDDDDASRFTTVTTVTTVKDDRKSTLLELVNREIWSQDEARVEGSLTHLADVCMSRTGKPNDTRSAVARMGGVLAIVKAMEIHDDNVAIQAEGCRALANLSLEKSVKDIIADAEGIETVLNSMESFLEHEIVQQTGICALRNMVCHSDANKNRLVHCGGIPVLVSAMMSHSASSIIQGSACGALENLSAGGDSIKDCIIDAGGTVAIARAAKDHRDDPDIQAKATGAMSQLFKHWQA